MTQTIGGGSSSAAVEVIQKHWAEAADLARLTESQRNYLWHRQILNPYASYGYAQNDS